ncbi:hypothetical protein HMPREF9248_0622 [Fannyhessea vaginae PB189-T1-4]|uniref:Uncharacterized protein n=1 Tax=Fannyhessea vaginae PB189-T1-4 TaxID=866774 RepID=A0ABN0B1P4_9ACTN|nr:hypothetical protein HMPREF9248_0622 [Fannyhessea vaginae PB189-T1-4]
MHVACMQCEDSMKRTNNSSCAQLEATIKKEHANIKLGVLIFSI